MSLTLKGAWCKVIAWCDNPPWLTAEQISALITENELIRIFEGEDAGTTDTGRFNLSQGNGNEHATMASAFGWGTVLPRDFEVLFVTFGARINPADGSQYQLTKSVGGAANTLVGPVLTLPGGQLTGVFPMNEIYSAGDALNIWTIEAGATDIVASVWGRWI